MKKLLILLLALVMCLSVLTSCDQIKGFIDGIIGGEEPPVTNTQADSAITLIKDDLKDWNVTAADYQLNAYTHQGEVKVEWSVNVDAYYVRITHDYENGIVYVDVNEESTTDVAYVLTAKVTDAEGNVRETSFNLTLPKDKLTTYDELVAAEKDATLKVQGIVVGIIKKSDGWGANSLYIQDAENKGGYYAYNLADEEIAGVEVGMTVKVTGTKDTYNGIYEVMNGKVDIVDTTIKAVTPVDYTEVFANAADTKAEDLIYRQSMLVTVKGVELSTQNEAQGYLNFKLAGKEAYVRISSSNNCITKAEADALKALHASNFGNTADVTGIIQLYNGAFYLIPATGVDAISNIKEVEKTPAEKVAAEKDNLAIDASYSADGDYTLPVAGTNYADVVISWASNSEYVVVGANGVITVKVPDTKTEVVLTATLTCGEATATKEITITLNKSITSIADANAIGAAQGSDYTAEKYLVAGVVTEVANATYGNLYISNGTDKFYIYGLYDAEGNRYDKMANAPAVGDYVVVLTSLGQYKGAPQGKNATLVTHVAPTTIVEANTIGAAQGSDYTTEKYLVTGVVDEVANATYGNIYIKDADGTRFYIYGLYDQAGNRYDKMATAPKVGDTITVLTTLGQYKGAPQGKNATLVAHTVATEEPPVENNDPTPDTELTIPEAAALGASKEHNTYTEGKYYVVGTVKEVQGAQYGNLLIEDADGNTILVYGTYSADGKVRYDAMETRPVVGDTIKVYGIVGQYNGTAQLKNAWLIETTVNHTHDYKDVTVEATCTEAGSVTPTCACGVVDEENVKATAPHSVSGVCSTCGTAIVNVSDLTITTTTDAELVEGTGISASAGLAIDANGKSIDGYKFTHRLKLGGTMKFEDDVVKAGVKIVVDGPATIVVYGMSSSSSAVRTLRLCTLTDGALVDVMINEEVAGDAIGKYVFTVEAAGTYYLGSKSSGINLYYISVATEKEDAPVVGGGTADLDTLAPVDPTKAENSYVDRTTTAGWTATSARSDEQAAFGEDPQILLNGKKTAVGTLVSPTLSGGIKSLSLNYGNAFSESNGVSLTINVKVNGEVVATTQLVDTSVTQNVGESFTWTLDTPVTGDFVLEIINNCPTQSTSNKDRVSLWNIVWN